MVRVRFAPSPTGALHIGGVRTALYCYLFAKKSKGKFLLRIEDTDRARYVDGAEEYIIETLKWCGIEPNEGAGFGDGEFGPYRQSARKEIYWKYVQQLLDEGKAYRAFDTTDELDSMRKMLADKGSASLQYDAAIRMQMKNSLTMTADEVNSYLEKKTPHVIRIKMPENEEVTFEDIIRGAITFNTKQLDDKILIKSDGMPTYHLANVVDDCLMKISHVIRGEEWLPSAPLHVMLYKFLGWENEMPEFAHLPLILRPDGNGKLSKRDGDRIGFPVYPLNWKDPKTREESQGFRERGFFPEAFINMLAFLGWNPGNEQEIFSKEELVESFSLERVVKAGAKFDFEKAKWFNQQHLFKKSGKELAVLIKPMIEDEGWDYEEIFVTKACEILKERCTFPVDFKDLGYYLFEDIREYDNKMIRKKWKEDSRKTLRPLLMKIFKDEDFSAGNIETHVKDFLEENNLGFGAVLPAFRLAMTGTMKGPPVFDIMGFLGKDRAMNRIIASFKYFDSQISLN